MSLSLAFAYTDLRSARERIAAMLNLHVSDGTEVGCCEECRKPYPCPTRRVGGAG